MSQTLFSKFNASLKRFLIVKIAWSPIYIHPLPDGHRFPMEGYQLIPRAIALRRGQAEPETLFIPGVFSEEAILCIQPLCVEQVKSIYYHLPK